MRIGVPHSRGGQGGDHLKKAALLWLMKNDSKILFGQFSDNRPCRSTEGVPRPPVVWLARTALRSLINSSTPSAAGRSTNRLDPSRARRGQVFSLPAAAAAQPEAE